jgi:hypothetical protein
MSDRLEDDLMEDLMAEPEGRGGSADEFDEVEGYDEADESDEADEYDEYDEYDEADEFDESEGDEGADELEEVVAEALEADDADEFNFGGFLKKIGAGARKVASVAKMIPLPQAQLIGGAADMIGNILADEGDEFDALDAMADFAEEEDGFDALAPVVAGLAIKGALKTKAAKIPPVTRRKLVKAVSTATKQLARKHGAHAAVAAPAIVHAARKIVARRGLPAKHLPAVVKRVTKVALRSPRTMHRLVNTGTRMRAMAGSSSRTAGYHGVRRRRHRGVGFSSPGGVGRWSQGGMGYSSPGGVGYSPTGTAGGGKTRVGKFGRSGRFSTGGGALHGDPGGYCAHCRRRTFNLRGPVSLTIVSR